MKKRLSSKALDALEQMAYAKSSIHSVSVPIGLFSADGSLSDVVRVSGGDVSPCDMDPVLSIPVRMAGILKKKRYKICYGGRGSAKTRSIVSVLVERARIQFERILCCREIQRSIQESSYQEIVDEISRRGLDDEFKVLDTKITHLATGSTFSFEGLFRNQTKIKGYAGATVCWVEEGENISQKSWDILSPTIRATGSEIWVSFNPANDDDPTYTEHVLPFLPLDDGVAENDTYVVININYDQNPWFPAELELERQKMERTDYDRYAWVWLGQFYNRKESQVLAGKWSVQEFETDELGDPLFGADFGFAADPSTLIRMHVHNNSLYISHEAFGYNVELDDHRALYDTVPAATDHVIRADNARPETISHLNKKWHDGNRPRRGFAVVAAKKGSGSVEAGIDFLRSFDHIYIHPRCKETAEEARLWSYKVDARTDQVLPKLVDANNHAWDAIRYALEPLSLIGSSAGLLAPKRLRKR